MHAGGWFHAPGHELGWVEALGELDLHSIPDGRLRYGREPGLPEHDDLILRASVGPGSLNVLTPQQQETDAKYHTDQARR